MLLFILGIICVAIVLIKDLKDTNLVTYAVGFLASNHFGVDYQRRL